MRSLRPAAAPGLAALGREFAKFGTVGGLGIVVNLAVFNLCRAVTGLPVVRCSVVATVVAIAFNYLGLRHFAYRDRDRSRRSRQVALFAAFSAVGLVIENGVLYAATYTFGWDTPFENNLFKFLGIGAATLFRFWSYRAWVFRALLPGETGATGDTGGTGSTGGAGGTGTGDTGGTGGPTDHGEPSNSTSNPAAYHPETTAPPP
ncbi:GtrA family protein [Streptomyces nondiastaticus]|uniref:GtrA family protein n=1 Tax=Streptomyces nondiastaticus TaxID=3154512 RepID=UPI0034177A20